jgi:hypothetical protein
MAKLILKYNDYDVSILQYEACDVYIGQNDIERLGYAKNITFEEMVDKAINNKCIIITKNGGGKWYLKGLNKKYVDSKEKIEKNVGKYPRIKCWLIEMPDVTRSQNTKTTLSSVEKVAKNESLHYLINAPIFLYNFLMVCFNSLIVYLVYNSNDYCDGYNNKTNAIEAINPTSFTNKSGVCSNCHIMESKEEIGKLEITRVLRNIKRVVYRGMDMMEPEF